VDPRSPCIIGVATRTWRPEDGDAPEPLDLWVEVGRAAVADAGARSPVLPAVDALHVVHCMSWSYDDPPRRLAEELGLHARHRESSILAGTSGQRMVNAAAERMLAGQSDLALVVGGEALATLRRHRAAGEAPAWRHPSPDADAPPIDLEEWIWPTEWAHDVIQPVVTFAAMDTARRARVGLGPAEHLRAEAEVFSRASNVAARHPDAWFPTAYEPAELTTVTAQNRLVAAPYPKRMVAIMDVDMAAALVVASHARADALGVPLERRIYLRGWGFARDATHVAERPHLDRSEALASAVHGALGYAGIGVDDLTHLDLYSCFPSAVLFALDALGLDPAEPRPVTVTGGLPYHGGPASNYTTHSIAEMVRRLRDDGAGYGLVTGVGMQMTKHVAAVYGVAPGLVHSPDYGALQAPAERSPLRRVVPAVESEVPATIAAYTVEHDRSGSATSALAVVDLAGGLRAYARTVDVDALAALRDGEWVGRRVRLRPGAGGVNVLSV
jgi:acetyl-CoA C-acetyltransferase